MILECNDYNACLVIVITKLNVKKLIYKNQKMALSRYEQFHSV